MLCVEVLRPSSPKSLPVSRLKKTQGKHTTINCAFSCACSRFAGKSTTGKRNSKFFNSFLNRLDGLSPNHFKGVHKNDIPIVEDLLTLIILLYHVDFVDGNFIGKLAKRRVEKYDNTVRLLRYNNQLCYGSNNDAFFQSFRCPNLTLSSAELSNWSDI